MHLELMASLRKTLARLRLAALLVVAAGVLVSPVSKADEKGEADGFRSIFDGESLEDWDGDPKFWRVEDGAITGETTEENPTPRNTFMIWRGGEPADFELKLEFRILGHNSGVQVRSEDQGDWVVHGYQPDMDIKGDWTGAIYEEGGRGLLARRGEKTVIDEEGNKETTRFGDADELLRQVRDRDWNDYHIIARGPELVTMINGFLMAHVIDRQEDAAAEDGVIAFQLHSGPPMKVQFRNIRLKELNAENQESGGRDDLKKIVFIAGPRSHGYGAHEHQAGCMLLADALNESSLPVQAEVHTDGWPEDESVLEDADSIVIYSDGGGRHPFNEHLETLDRLMKQGTGLAAIHYAVEVPKGDSGNAFLDWTGGYFEAHWSVNPHWTAEFKTLPEHEIARGVRPFTLNDEWYYHMRFRDDLEGVTPILSDLPPEQSLERPDGSHSGNPHVRSAVLEREERQHLAWARERPDGGRGFGITGGHWHWNWGHDDFRTLVLNAIVWTAGMDVPEAGVPSRSLTVEDLEANQDFPQPDDFNRARIQAMLDEWNRPADSDQ